jgi:hypothetical protein
MELRAFVMQWIDLVIDFLRLVGLDKVADEISSKIVMPL